MKRFLIHLFVQLGVLIVVGVMAGVGALIAMGTVGGVAMGVAPEFTFGLVADYVCPEGELEYYAVERSYHEPGASEPHVDCITADGAKEDVLLPAILAVLGGTFLGSFLIVFVPVFLILAIIAYVITRKIIGSSSDDV